MGVEELGFGSQRSARPTFSVSGASAGDDLSDVSHTPTPMDPESTSPAASTDMLGMLATSKLREGHLTPTPFLYLNCHTKPYT